MITKILAQPDKKPIVKYNIIIRKMAKNDNSDNIIPNATFMRSNLSD